MKHKASLALLLSTMLWSAPPAIGALTRHTVNPQRIVWASDTTGRYISDTGCLLSPFSGQVSVADREGTHLRSDSSHQAALLLDFGKELHGGVRIHSANRANNTPVSLRVRLGESVTEAMSDVTPGNNPSNATNEHSMRDFIVKAPWLGTIECGNSGFRFVRIDLLDEEVDYVLRHIEAVSVMIDDPEIGTFSSSDGRVDSIWSVGVYTVKLNVQDYVWDGVKRDRLVWLGDMHPEVMTIANVWGNLPAVHRSLDFARDDTPLPGWINGMSSYSLWWVIILHDLYLYQGDLAFLQSQAEYLHQLVDQIASKVGDDGVEQLDGARFLDWPTSDKPEAIHCGLQALTHWSMQCAVVLGEQLGDKAMANTARDCMRRLERHHPSCAGNSQAAALAIIAGMSTDPESDAQVILANGVNTFSTFYGYYMLEALAQTGHLAEGLEMMKQYWGAMLDLGATTFWEDLSYSDIANAGRIDEIVPQGKYDIHAEGGAYCYKGLRLSLCHGWASGPTSWLSRYVLGVKPLTPGCAQVAVTPSLGSLDHAEGTVPTPHGPIHVKAWKDRRGKTQCLVEAPDGVKVESTGRSTAQN